MELYLELVNAEGEIVSAQTIPMYATGAKTGDGHTFEESSVACGRSGLHGVTVRVLPRHAD